jgi:DNA-binding MarR family transcriptional regulator
MKIDPKPASTASTRTRSTAPAQGTGVERPLEENLSYQLSYLNFLMSRAITPVLLSHGVTNQQWKVLSVLCQIAPATAQEVTGWVTLDKSAVSRIVRSLQQQNILTRKLMGDDGRHVHLLLTAKGTALYRRVAAELSALQAELMQDVSRAAYNTLFESLHSVEKRLNEHFSAAAQADEETAEEVE